MSVATYEGFIDELGQVRLLEPVALPIRARVFIVVPELDEKLGDKPRHIYSPWLVNPKDAGDFQLKEVTSTNYAAL